MATVADRPDGLVTVLAAFLLCVFDCLANFRKVAAVAVPLRCGADLWRGVCASFVCQTSCLAKFASHVSSKKSCRTRVSAQCLYA